MNAYAATKKNMFQCLKCFKANTASRNGCRHSPDRDVRLQSLSTRFYSLLKGHLGVFWCELFEIKPQFKILPLKVKETVQTKIRIKNETKSSLVLKVKSNMDFKGHADITNPHKIHWCSFNITQIS